MSSSPISVVILAAGLGTRMRSRLAKVLHRAGGACLLEHVIEAACEIAPRERIVAVVGHQAERVRAEVEHSGVRFAVQTEQKGTGHALGICAGLEGLDEGRIVVLYGDCPLLRPETLHQLMQRHEESGCAATLIALVLGTLVAFGIHRFRFFGRDTVSLMLVLPIALPGIVTGLALQSAFNIAHIDLSIYTIIVGHATFCMVVVFNNVVARLRRTSSSLIEASSDLGARPLQTFRLVTLPMLSTAIIAGALLAFALSFDEVIVTTFTAGAQNTLPLWIFGAIQRGQQLPEVNAVVVFVLILTIVPIAYAARISSGERSFGSAESK